MFDQLKNLKQLAGLMGNAGELREKMEKFQAELERLTTEADAGAGAVRVTVNGKLQVLSVSLDPTMISALTGEGTEADRAMIEELIVSATNEAMRRVQELVKQEMSKQMGGMDLPGLEGMMGGMG